MSFNTYTKGQDCTPDLQHSFLEDALTPQKVCNKNNISKFLEMESLPFFFCIILGWREWAIQYHICIFFNFLV